MCVALHYTTLVRRLSKQSCSHAGCNRAILENAKRMKHLRILQKLSETDRFFSKSLFCFLKVFFRRVRCVYWRVSFEGFLLKGFFWRVSCEDFVLRVFFEGIFEDFFRVFVLGFSLRVFFSGFFKGLFGIVKGFLKDFSKDFSEF
jgi:hypothetical protein